MREQFLSMNDIKKQKPGFKFFTKKNFTLLELLSVETKTIHVASGILGDTYQDVITIKAMDEKGEIYIENNLTNKLNGGNIYNIAYIEKDWDQLRFKTVNSVVKEKKKEYKGYFEEFVRDGKIAESDMFKFLDEWSFHGIKFGEV